MWQAGQAEAAAIEKAAEAAQGESAREGEIRAHLARKKAVEELVKMRLEVSGGLPPSHSVCTLIVGVLYDYCH